MGCRIQNGNLGGVLMGKLTARLIKYYVSIIAALIITCFALSSIFLSLIYTKIEYTSLKNAAHEIYSSIKSNSSNSDILSNYQISSAFLIKDDSIRSLTSSKMGMMQMLRNMDISKLQEKGKYKNPMNEEFLYYKYPTELGDIIVLQNNKFSANFLNTTYIILLIVFLLAIIISIPVAAFVGKKITKPILELQKAALDITNGNFDIDVDVNTEDEIEELSNSIKNMAATLGKKDTLQRNFAANVSHDFKTPLSIIRNCSEAIYDDIISENDKKNYLKEIIQEVDRLNHLVMDILQLSKLQGGVNILEKQYFSLSEFLSGFQNTFKLLAYNKGMKLSVTSVDIEVYGDAKYLYRVVYNFIDNAIKFGDENTEVKVNACLIDKGVKVSVKNYGKGIDADMISDIWDRYYKSSKSGGMGLGLAICSEILKLHDFKYGVMSSPNKETEFYFIIPI
jgi:signal transduction histidine kinase